jgi:hypothetical protein
MSLAAANAKLKSYLSDQVEPIKTVNNDVQYKCLHCFKEFWKTFRIAIHFFGPGKGVLTYPDCPEEVLEEITGLRDRVEKAKDNKRERHKRQSPIFRK